MGQETRNKLTDYWKEHDINEGEEFAILTNIIHQEWSGVTVKDHKSIKGLKTQNLRDHMTEAELIFTALADPGINPGEHTADRGDRAGRRHAEEQGGREEGRRHCEEGATGIGAAHWEVGGVGK